MNPYVDSINVSTILRLLITTEDKEMAGPKLMITGKAAMEAVAKVLPTAHSITVNSSLGPVELKPGTIWSGNKLLFYCAPLYVYYAIDDRTYEWGTGDFVRDEWLNALAEGARRASHWIVIAKIEMALITGIFAPWYVLLGMGCAKVGLFYYGNKAEMDIAFAQAPKVIECLKYIRSKAPTLFNKLMADAAKQLVLALPSGVTAEDIAFFVGRLIKGAAGAGPELTLKMFLGILAKVAAIVTATHLPSIAAHAVSKAAKKQAEELRKKLAEAGFTVTEAEAKTILGELASASDMPSKLKELEAACKALAPSLEKLKSAYARAE